MTENELAIVLVSGGMDSCVTTALANERYRLALLHVTYGQRTESRELRAFRDIASYYNVPESRILISRVDYLGKIGGSSLTDLSINVQDAKLHSKEIPTSYVPFRNTLFLTIAVSWGEVIGAKKIFIGAVEQDSPGYPDCRPIYIMKPLTNLSRQARNPQRASRWKPRSLAKANQRL